MRKLLAKSSISPGWLVLGFCLLFVIFSVAAATGVKAASNSIPSGKRLIAIHDNGTDKAVITSGTTLRQVFKEAAIRIDKNDMVEPGLDDNLVASNYEVNVYRARPVTVIDGAVRQRVMSPYRTAQQIVASAGMTLRGEDLTSLDVTTNLVRDGAGLQLTIKRATPFTLVLYGKKIQAYTQAKSVEAVLKEKNIKLAPADSLSVPSTTLISAGMTVELWRNGKQTITEEQPIAFGTDQIQDADRPVGYKLVKTPGVTGKKTVTYQVDMRNGQEISRAEIQSVVTLQPQKQVEVVGAKPSFSGDFAAALAKLRSCEGGYNSWNPAGPYYGAYQFDQRTWNSSAPAGAPYGSATPAQQDQAARNLYVRRGWSPWPNCGAGLPDIYR